MAHDPLMKIKLAMHFLSAGVVPLGWGDESATSVPQHFDINRLLEQMSPEEALLARRKFRKLWRKLAAAAKKREGSKSRMVLRSLGDGKPAPTRRDKTNRKFMVFRDASKKINKAT